MSFATKTTLLRGVPLASDIGETLRFDTALDLREGGTGVAASGADNAARAIDVLKTWGVLDSNGEFELSLFPDITSLVPVPGVMTGATSSTAGAAGTAPQPASGTQRRALRGDATYSNELELAWIVDADGNRLHQISKLGDGANGLFFAAIGDGSGRSRIGNRSTSDDDVDFVIEPKGKGQITHYGDSVEKTIQRVRGYRAHADSDTFEVIGLASGISHDSSGAVLSELDDDEGHYAMSTVGGTTSGLNGGFLGDSAWVQRQHNPEITICGHTSLINARVYIAFATADPVLLTTWAATGVQGLAVWVDYNVHSASRTLRLLTSSGLAYSLSQTGVFSVDSSGRLDRNDGGSFLTDGVRVGDLVTIGGFASQVSSTHRVASITAGTGRRLVFDTPMIQEVSPAGAVTVTHPGQSEIDTGYTLTANTRYQIRLRYIAATYQWEFAVYDFGAQTWGNFTYSDGVAPIPPDVKLTPYVRQRTVNAQSPAAKTGVESILVRNRL